jgi:hypothetical protein
MECHSRAVNHANFHTPKGMKDIYKVVASGLGDGITIQSASCPQEKTAAVEAASETQASYCTITAPAPPAALLLFLLPLRLLLLLLLLLLWRLLLRRKLRIALSPHPHLLPLSYCSYYRYRSCRCSSYCCCGGCF